MPMRFEFVPDPQVLRPSFPIFIRAAGGGPEVPVDALLDTGADICIFDSKLCKKLGIPFERGQPGDFSGAGAGGDGFYHDIVFETKLPHEAIPMKPLFLKGALETFGFAGILGIRGFLDKFSVFVDAKERYSLVEKL